jgi:hypothetical protein
MAKYAAELYEDNGGGLHWVREVDGEIVAYRATNGSVLDGRAGDQLVEIAAVGFREWDSAEEWETPDAAQQTIDHSETELIARIEVNSHPGGQASKALGFGRDDWREEGE